jgi:hypothetical protein
MGDLDVFVGGFLVPAVADGVLSAAEESPLFAAFEAFEIDARVSKEPEATLQVLTESIRSAPAAGLVEPRAAWEALLARSDRLTEAQLALSAEWFRQRGVDARLTGHSAGCVLSPRAYSQRFRRFVALLNRVAPDLKEAQRDTGSVTDHRFVVKTFDADPLTCERVWDGRIAARLTESAGELVAAVQDVVAGRWSALTAFDEFRRGPDELVISANPRPDDCVWFLGDVHGSLLALECVLAHIRHVDGDRAPVVVWLGDAVDRGEQSFEVVLRLFEQIASSPRQVCFIAGNHDEGLVWREDRQSFASSVQPSEFAEYLNGEPEEVACDVARAFVEFVARSPRALFLSDGLFAAHGGIPQSDLWPTLTSRAALNQPLCLQDFVWTRAHPRARSRFPGRSSRGADFGRDDFRDFCKIASELLGHPVLAMVRGHDHVAGQFSLYEEYRERRMLTVNTMCDPAYEGTRHARTDTPCAARWVPGGLPEVHRIVIPRRNGRVDWDDAVRICE